MPEVFKKRYFLTLLFLCAASAAEAGILCPDSGRGLTVKGPDITKKMSGQTVVTCEYHNGRKLAGVIKAYYYNNSERSKECGSAAFRNSKGASQTHRVYMDFKDNNLKDDYRESLWHTLGMRLISISEGFALPCVIDRKMIIGAGS